MVIISRCCWRLFSAQTTDKQVNKTTKRLFQIIKKPEDILEMNIEQLEKALQGCGLYRQKAGKLWKHLGILCQRHGESRERLRN